MKRHPFFDPVARSPRTSRQRLLTRLAGPNKLVNMRTKTIADDPRVKAFAESARAFCLVIERRTKLTKRQFVHQCAEAIPVLLVRFIPLLEVKTGRAVDITTIDRGVSRFTHERWEKLFRSIARKLGKDDAYHDVFNPYKVQQDDPVYRPLSDDLADIYRDLKEGLSFFGRGDERSLHSAV